MCCFTLVSIYLLSAQHFYYIYPIPHRDWTVAHTIGSANTNGDACTNISSSRRRQDRTTRYSATIPCVYVATSSAGHNYLGLQQPLTPHHTMSMSSTSGRLSTTTALFCSLLLASSRSLAFAAPSIKVDLQAAFPAPPFLLELLYIVPDPYHATLRTNPTTGNPQQSKMHPPSSHSSTLLRLAASARPPTIMTFTRSFWTS
jgi:hypothetical protein